jgi:cyanate permease
MVAGGTTDQPDLIARCFARSSGATIRSLGRHLAMKRCSFLTGLGIVVALMLAPGVVRAQGNFEIQVYGSDPVHALRGV